MLVNTPQPQDLQVRHGDLALPLGSSSQVMSLAHDTYSEHETFPAWRDQGPGILPLMIPTKSLKTNDRPWPHSNPKILFGYSLNNGK